MVPQKAEISEETTFYVVRHGQTDWNVQNIVQGHHDIPLNNVGRSESLSLSQTLMQTRFSACFSSDLKRAFETAQIVVQNRPLEIKSYPRLRERYFGPLWQGRPFAEYLQSPQELRQDVESETQVKSRVLASFLDMVTHHPGSPILVVTHGGVLRLLLGHILALDFTQHEMSTQNNCVAKIVFTQDSWKVHELKGIELKKKEP